MKNLAILASVIAVTVTGDVLADRVTCESRNNQRQECEMDTHGEVRLVEQHSHAACIEGESWGLNKHTIWVDRGCRGTFESEGAAAYGIVEEDAGRSSGPTSENIRACNAVEDWYGEVVESTALKPGAWEIILDYGAEGRYVCNVEGSRVTYFERLRGQ